MRIKVSKRKMTLNGIISFITVDDKNIQKKYDIKWNISFIIVIDELTNRFFFCIIREEGVGWGFCGFFNTL